MSADNFYDVAVIGSGPAGTIAAQKLSSNGLRVILFEKAPLPRYKTCGGGIVNRALKYLPSGISSMFEKQFNQIEIHDHQADFYYNVIRNSPLVYATMRNDFDFALLEKAKSSGTQVLEQCEVYDLVTTNEYVILKTKKGDFKTLFVIGADGAQGITLKKSGLKIKRKNFPALECEVFIPSGDLQKFSTLRFDFGFIPGGYAWVFPKNDHLSIGLGVFALRQLKINLHLYFNNYLNLLGLNKIRSIERHGFYIPVSLRKNIIANNRILLAGDAAALADPITAEGITSAVLSGHLSAEAIIEGNLNYKIIHLLYQKKILDNIYSELNAELLLSRAYYNYSRLRIFLIKRYGIKFCEIIADVISGEKKYSQLTNNPFNYLKLIKYYFNPPSHFLEPGHNI